HSALSAGATVRSGVTRLRLRRLRDDALGELARRVESHHAPLRDRNALAAAQIARPALRALFRLEAAEAFELHGLAGFERRAHLLEDCIDHVAALALAQADVLEEEILQLLFRERRAHDR